jgi:hypothetical protein
MAQKLTLTEYLRRRGAIKALTRIEAETFGIPYPLQSGWPARFAGMEITKPMLEELAKRIASAKESTARKAQGGLNAATSLLSKPAPVPPTARTRVSAPPVSSVAVSAIPVTASSISGFVLRQARRYRSRSSVPW